MTDADARAFAAEWIAAWNAHDLDRVLRHYHDDVSLTTPFIARMLGDQRGMIAGKDALRAFWSRALERFPTLTFTLYAAYAGVDSVVLHYRAVDDLVGTEFLRFDVDGRVTEVVAHYRSVSDLQLGQART